MPYKRVKKNRKRRKKKTTQVSEKVQYGIVKTINYGGFHCFKEKQIFTFDLTSVGGPATNPNVPSSCYGGFGSTRGLSFTLTGNVPITGNVIPASQGTHYKQLFDFWKVVGVKMVINPDYTQKVMDNTPIVPASTQIPRWWYYEENPKGNTNPTNISTVIKKSRTKYRMADKPLVIYFKPKVAKLQINNVAAQTAVNNTEYVPDIGSNDWIPTKKSSALGGYEPSETQYSGFCFGQMTPSMPNGTVTQYQAVVTTYYQFKGNA